MIWGAITFIAGVACFTIGPPIVGWIVYQFSVRCFGSPRR